MRRLAAAPDTWRRRTESYSYIPGVARNPCEPVAGRRSVCVLLEDYGGQVPHVPVILDEWKLSACCTRTLSWVMRRPVVVYAADLRMLPYCCSSSKPEFASFRGFRPDNRSASFKERPKWRQEQGA